MAIGRDRYSPFDLAAFNATLDHGLLLGLTDNDHTQYVNAVSDTSSINLTLTGQSISGAVIPGGVDHDALLNVHQDVNTTASPIWVGATLSGLTAGRVLFAGTGGVIDDDGELLWNDTTKRLTTTGVTITGCSVLGLNSAIFQPTTDSTTFLQVLDADGGTPIFNVDTTNKRIGINCIPEVGLDIAGERLRVQGKGSAPTTGAGFEMFYDDVEGLANFQVFDRDTTQYKELRFNALFTTFKSSGGVVDVIFSSNGNVGIGNAGPLSKLHITDNNMSLILERGVAARKNEILYKTGASSNWFVGLPDSDIAGDGSEYFIGTTTGGANPALWIETNGDVGFGGETAPETPIELTHAQPNKTAHCSTHSDDDNSGAATDFYKREDGAGTETFSFSFTASHDGAGVNDQLSKGVWKVNTGAGLVAVVEIDSSANTKIGDAGITNYTNIDADGDLSFVGTSRIDWTKITANAVSIENGHGVITGLVGTLQTAHDGSFIEVAEEAETPGIEFLVDFISVTAFNWVNIIGCYDANTTTHAIAIQLYNYTRTRWDTFDSINKEICDITTEDGYILGNHDFIVPDDTEYIGTGDDAGKVRVRFYHTMGGAAAHDLRLDVVALYQ